MRIVKFALSLTVLFCLVIGVSGLLPDPDRVGRAAVSSEESGTTDDTFVNVLAAALPGENATNVVIGGNTSRIRNWTLPLPLALAATRIEKQYTAKINDWHSKNSRDPEIRSLGSIPEMTRFHRIDAPNWTIITLPLAPAKFVGAEFFETKPPARANKTHRQSLSFLLTESSGSRQSTTVTAHILDLSSLSGAEPNWIPPSLRRLPGQMEMVRYQPEASASAPRIILRFQDTGSGSGISARIEQLKLHAAPYEIISRGQTVAVLKTEAAAGVNARVKFAFSREQALAIELLTIEAKQTEVGS